MPANSTADRRIRFSVRSLLIFTFVFCIVMAIVGIKLKEDYRRRIAFRELAQSGLQLTIGSEDGVGAIWARCQNAEFQSINHQRLIQHLLTLSRSHDLGWSSGDRIRKIDFTGYSVSTEVLADFKAAFPEAEIVDEGGQVLPSP